MDQSKSKHLNGYQNQQQSLPASRNLQTFSHKKMAACNKISSSFFQKLKIICIQNLDLLIHRNISR
jgi:hypothetical protein